MLNLENQLIFCNKYKINPNELLLLEILLLSQEDEYPEIIKSYFSSDSVSRGEIRELLIGLQNSGIILKSYKIPNKGEVFNPLNVPLNKNMIKDFYKYSFTLGKELFDHYPISTVVNSIEYKLRRVSKKFDSLEDAYRAYGKAIRWKPEIHDKIIKLIEDGKNSGYQFTILCDFIADEDWLNMEAISKDGVMNNNSNMKLL